MTPNPVAVVSALIAQMLVGLIIVAAFSVFVLGLKPKPCLRHICFPQNEIVTVEQMIREDPARFKPNRHRAR